MKGTVAIAGGQLNGTFTGQPQEVAGRGGRRDQNAVTGRPCAHSGQAAAA